jgi:SAM-dependent methyltransferase
MHPNISAPAPRVTKGWLPHRYIRGCHHQHTGSLVLILLTAACTRWGACSNRPHAGNGNAGLPAVPPSERPRWLSRRKGQYRADMPTDDHALVNRATWDEDAPNWVQRGREAWAKEEPVWGRGLPESELRLLPEMAGLDAIELGCGTAYVSAWLMRRGARVIGLDNSSNQLATARILQEEFGLRFPLVHADAERAPFPDASFDFAISQYGAAIWCDPYRWIPEASRILRSGGRLLFETGSPLVMCCFPTDDDDAPADTRLHRDYFGMHRFEWR